MSERDPEFIGTEPLRGAIGHDLGKPQITEVEIGRTTHLIVPDPEPFDTDGLRTMTVGTIAWGVIAVALLPFVGTLDGQGRTWWIWTAIAGFGLGLIGIEYCRRRRAARTHQPGRRRA